MCMGAERWWGGVKAGFETAVLLGGVCFSWVSSWKGKRGEGGNLWACGFRVGFFFFLSLTMFCFVLFCFLVREKGVREGGEMLGVWWLWWGMRGRGEEGERGTVSNQGWKRNSM